MLVLMREVVGWMGGREHRILATFIISQGTMEVEARKEQRG